MLLDVIIHKSMVIYWSLAANKKTDLTFIKILVEKHGSGVPHTVYGCSSVEPPPKILNECHIL
jgi:hypothetical protein